MRFYFHEVKQKVLCIFNYVTVQDLAKSMSSWG